MKLILMLYLLVACSASAQEIEFVPDRREIAVNEAITLRVIEPDVESSYQWIIDGVGGFDGAEVMVSWEASSVYVIQLVETNSTGDSLAHYDFVNVLPVMPESKTYEQAWQLLHERVINTAEQTIVQQANPYEAFPLRNLALEEAVFSPNWLYENFWTGGFWVGSLWRLYDRSGDDADLQRALQWSEGILGDETRDDHDRGFVYYYSSAFAYDRTGEEVYLDSVETAIAKMVELFENSFSEMIPILPRHRQVIIDTMMNLQLFWWHKDRVGDRPEWYAVAEQHANKTLELFFREDGSVWQNVDFGRFSGNVIALGSRQGFDDSEESTWSRGQAWAMFGFTEAWLATGNEAYLSAAENATRFFVENLPSDRVPWFDFNPTIFNDPNARLKDSSAAAIAADALLNLAESHPNQQQRQFYLEQSELMLQSLINNYLGTFSPLDETTQPGQLIHGCWFWREPSRRDSELIWGTYYLIDALNRLLNEPEIRNTTISVPGENALIIEATVFANRLEFASITADLTQLGDGELVSPDGFDQASGLAVWEVGAVPDHIEEAVIPLTLTDGFGRQARVEIQWKKTSDIIKWNQYN